MNLHEYQSKELFAKYGIPVLKSTVCSSPAETAQAFSAMQLTAGVVKSQIHAGGRGKAGGIITVYSAEEAKNAALKLLGRPLVTKQTGPQGKVVNKVLLEEACAVEKELYFSIAIDRKAEKPVALVSREGGMDIEEVADKFPDKIFKLHINPALGLQPFQARDIAYFMDPRKVILKDFSALAVNLSRLFLENDCSLVEINPLAIVKGRGLIALDAKIGIDDRALYRHKNLSDYRDISEEDPMEYEAEKNGLSYISLNGNIGCMVNGAGLAMATMDLIKLNGGEPANFLDVGGGASAEQVYTAFKLLLSNKNVKAILVNIFGGIMKCDIIAEGIVQATKEAHLNLPLVVRLEGTNVELGREILRKSGLKITAASDMNDAAAKVVQAVK
ncbi:MAG: ADP-forming succinate--CoA ligase subunit beta [Planctomycetes bacterium]|nr:ADP-forming succinate--CoA ligase subunit beta [Planctomycetota bacterium]